MIAITDIGVDGDSDMSLHSEPLICFTDKIDCCQTNHLGEWYLPDGSPASQNENFLVTGGDDGTVLLRRSNYDALSPTGSFCCSVQNSSDIIQNACIYEGRSSV